MNSLEKNISNIKARIAAAAKRAKRNPEDIKLVAVSKNFSADIVQQAVDKGMTLLGENRVQEARSKYGLIDGNVEWHLIGHLQKNKAKHAVKIFSMIQSLDSLELAEEINRRADKIDKTIDVLVQINIGLEEQKYGINPAQAVEFVEKAALFSNIRIKGLMAIAPFKEDPEEVRPYFRQMHDIFENLRKLDIENVEMRYLSMGMSNDFEIAIEEGSNMIRVGTSIFGARKANK